MAPSAKELLTFKSGIKYACAPEHDLTKQSGYERYGESIIRDMKMSRATDTNDKYWWRFARTIGKLCLDDEHLVAINAMALLNHACDTFGDAFVLNHIGKKAFFNKAFLFQLPNTLVFPEGFDWNKLKTHGLSEDARNQRLRVKWSLFLIKYWAMKYPRCHVFNIEFERQQQRGAIFPTRGLGGDALTRAPLVSKSAVVNRNEPIRNNMKKEKVCVARPYNFANDEN